MIRTVLGDIDPAVLGVCYAHEHIIIDDVWRRVFLSTPATACNRNPTTS